MSPNKPHYLALQAWYLRWPSARLYAPPDLSRKRPDIRFDGELRDEPEAQWAGDIKRAVLRSWFAIEEVVFFYRALRTAIVGDLIQRLPEASPAGWRAMSMRLDGLVGQHGSTLRERCASVCWAGSPSDCILRMVNSRLTA